MKPNKAHIVLRRLRGYFRRMNLRPENWPADRPPSSPFEILVATILSQNTNDKRSRAAYEQLRSHIGVTPEKLASADLREIELAVRPAGIYRQKARAIRDFSSALLTKYGGEMRKILDKPMEEARGILMSFKGIGSKTADVVLIFGARKPVIPVDTHVRRVSHRLGLAPETDYEKVRRSLESQIEPKHYGEFHFLLIQLGKVICKARKPDCEHCPLSDLCEYYAKYVKRN